MATFKMLNSQLCLSFIFITAVFPLIAHSTCSNISATYPLYSDTEIKLEKNIIVNGNNVSSGTYSTNSAININGVVSTVSQTLPDLNPPFFPSNNSSTDQTITSTTTLNNASETYYNKIEIDSENISVSFTGGGSIHINELKVKKKNTSLNFAAGTYYINKFKIESDKENVTVNVTSSPVIFHIGDEFKVEGEDATFNSSGNVDDFLVFLHSSAKFASKKENLNFTGLIYGPHNVEKVEIEGEDSSIHGAIIISGGKLEVKEEDISFTYTTADQTAISNITSCGDGSVIVSSCGNIPATYPQYNDTKIKLEKDISINGNTVSSNTYITNVAIDIVGTVNTGISLTLPNLDPVYFPSNSSSTDQTITSTTTLSNASETYYDKIEIDSENISVSFTGGGSIHINELKVKKKNTTLNFAAGTYYINKFKIESGKKNVTINISNSPVIFHIGDKFEVEGEDATFNSSGNVDDFLVYLHSSAKFESKKKNLDFTGLIYGPQNVEKVKIEGDDSTFHGAIITSGGKIEIKKSDNIFTYTSSDQTAIGNITTCEDGSVADTTAVGFNCVENGANGISGKLYTKTTAQSFSIDVIALQDSSTIETSFASSADHTVTIELVNSNSGGSCSAYSALSPTVSQSLIFTSSDAGNKASTPMNSGTAYSSVKCRITDATSSPSIVGCSTDSFSIRPTDFTLTSSLTNTASTGTPVAKAGDNFTLTATATTGYTGTPIIDTTKLQAHAGAIKTGTITGSFNAAVSGVATGTGFVYSEVGSIRFAAEGIYDDTFTSVDPSTECTDDFSNTAVLGKVGCKFGNTAASNYFGRFTPDHFDISLNAPAFEPACSSFTYLGQPFKYATNPVATVIAKNASGTTTQNYTGDFWKISSASLTPSYAEATYALNVLESSAPTVTDSNNGTGILTYADTSSNILALTKGALSAPYDAEIALSFLLTDTDSITVANVGGFAQTNPVKFGAETSGNGISFSGSNKTQRWGRVVLSNAHGSELSPLSVPLTTQYYNGTSFIQNTNDNCTSFSLASDFSISDTADFDCSFITQTSPVAIGSGSVKANLSNTTVTNGVTEVTLSDNTTTTNGPGAGNTGYIEISSNLSNLSWLLYDWDADSSHDNCPSARATFGIYKGNNNQIYFREVY